MKKMNAARVMALLLAVVLVCTSCQAGTGTASANSQAATESQGDTAAQQNQKSSAAVATSGEKNETVYVVLKPDGTPDQTIVTDWLHSDQGANGMTVNDNVSDLQNLQVLKGGTIESEDDGKVTWNASGSDVYYTGNSSRQLPLKVNIRYTLDGVEGDPQSMAGKSGHLKMDFSFENTQSQMETINGKSVRIYAPLTVIMGMVLSDDTFTNVTVSDNDSATVTSDGGKQTVAFVCMPGMEESIGLHDYDLKAFDDVDLTNSLTVEADVKNFEMDPVMIAASTKFPNFDVSTSELDEAQSDMNDLQRMQNDVLDTDADHQIRDIYTDERKTAGAQLMVSDIFDFYDMDKAILDVVDNYVNDTTIQLIDDLKEDVDRDELDEFVYGKSGQALLSLLKSIDSTKVEIAANDLKTVKSLTEKYKELIANTNSDNLFEAACSLGLTAQQNPIQTAGLCTAAGATANQLQNLLVLYNQSGIEDPAVAQLMGAIANFQKANNITSFTAEQWQTFVTAGLKAVGESLAGGNSLTESGPDLTESGPDLTESGTPTRTSASAPTPTPTPDLTESGDSNIVAGDQANSGLESGTESGGKASDTGTWVASTTLNPEKMVEFLTAVKTFKVTADGCFKAVGIDPTSQTDMAKLLTVASQLSGDASGIVAPMAGLMQDPTAYEELGDLLTAGKNGELTSLKNTLLGHMKANAGTIAALENLASSQDVDLDALEDLLDNSSDLAKDAKRGYHLLTSLLDDLDTDEMDRSLHNAPKSMDTLMKMKNDLEEYRDVSESLRRAVAPDSVTAFRDVFSTLDRFSAEGTVDKDQAKIDDARAMLNRKDAYQALADQNTIFTAAPQGFDTDLKFIMKTSEVKIPDTTAAATTTTTAKTTLLDRVKNFFTSIFHKGSN